MATCQKENNSMRAHSLESNVVLSWKKIHDLLFSPLNFLSHFLCRFFCLCSKIKQICCKIYNFDDTNKRRKENYKEKRCAASWHAVHRVELIGIDRKEVVDRIGNKKNWYPQQQQSPVSTLNIATMHGEQWKRQIYYYWKYTVWCLFNNDRVGAQMWCLIKMHIIIWILIIIVIVIFNSIREAGPEHQPIPEWGEVEWSLSLSLSLFLEAVCCTHIQFIHDEVAVNWLPSTKRVQKQIVDDFLWVRFDSI